MLALGIQEVSLDECRKLVGVGTDGASANIAASGLKGLVEGRLGCVFFDVVHGASIGASY